MSETTMLVAVHGPDHARATVFEHHGTKASVKIQAGEQAEVSLLFASPDEAKAWLLAAHAQVEAQERKDDDSSDTARALERQEVT